MHAKIDIALCVGSDIKFFDDLGVDDALRSTYATNNAGAFETHASEDERLPWELIETTYDLPRNLTIIKAVGRMEPGDFREWTAHYYTGTVTLHTLWDLTQADLSAIQTNDLRNDAAHTKDLADVRKGGKMAIVSANTLACGLSRMLEAFYGLEEIIFDVQVFRTLEKARAWLGA